VLWRHDVANTTAKFRGEQAVRTVGGGPVCMGWCYAHAEGSGATSQGCGKVAGRRGSHNDWSTLAS